MKNARQLLVDYLALSLRDPNKAAEMFAEDGAFEMPYLESMGYPGRYLGTESIGQFFSFVHELYPELKFYDTKILCEQADEQVVFAEYEFTTRSSRTGRLIHQLFMGLLVAENGKIKLLRESINLIELGRALYANGLADLKLPSEDEPGVASSTPIK